MATLACRLFLGLLFGLFLAAGLLTPAFANERGAGWERLAVPKTVAIMRHAIAPGIGDPEDFQIGDCKTQRNLNDNGRLQARHIGETIRAAGVTVDRILSSQWCRCLETARLLDLGPVEELASLNSFFADRSTEAAQTEALRAFLRRVTDGETVILVTHQVNITALTGLYTASGEAILLRVEPDGALTVTGRIQTSFKEVH